MLLCMLVVFGRMLSGCMSLASLRLFVCAAAVVAVVLELPRNLAARADSCVNMFGCFSRLSIPSYVKAKDPMQYGSKRGDMRTPSSDL